MANTDISKTSLLVEFDREIDLILHAEPHRATQLLLDAYLKNDRHGYGVEFAAALATRLALTQARLESKAKNETHMV